LFEVIQNEQEWPGILEVSTENLVNAPIGHLPDIQRFGQRRQEEIRICDGRQSHELHSRVELRGDCRRRRDCQAGLSRASRAGYGQQSNIGLLQKADCLVDLAFAANQRGSRRGEVDVGSRQRCLGGCTVNRIRGLRYASVEHIPAAGHGFEQLLVVVVKRAPQFDRALHQGIVGWYSFRAVNGVLVEDNLIRGEGPFASGGTYAHAWSERSRNIYTANNTYSEIMGFDAEAFTSDGGGGVYFGPAQQSRGRTLVLEGTPDWGSTANWKDHWKGALVAIIAGHGAGQWRTLESWSGQEVELSEGFGIAPDTTSRITIVPLQLHYIFYRNHFSNAGVAIQFYGVAVEHIVAENDESNAGGFYFSAHRYVGGVAPQLNVQLLENHVREGWNYHFGPNHMPAPGPSLIKVVSHAPSAVIGMVIRNNELAAGSTIEVHSESPSGVIGMLVDKNRVSNGKHDLQIDPSVAGEVLITQ